MRNFRVYRRQRGTHRTRLHSPRTPPPTSTIYVFFSVRRCNVVHDTCWFVLVYAWHDHV